MLPGVRQGGCMQRNKIIFLTDLISIYGLLGFSAVRNWILIFSLPAILVTLVLLKKKF